MVILFSLYKNLSDILQLSFIKLFVQFLIMNGRNNFIDFIVVHQERGPFYVFFFFR